VSKFDDLKNAKSLADLAILLEFTPSGLAYVLYKVLPEQKYTKFEIPKKNGGVRQISAPVGALKMLQRHLADLLYDCRAEMQAARPRRPLSHGFRRSQSIIGNARLHKIEGSSLIWTFTTSFRRSILVGSVGSSSRIAILRSTRRWRQLSRK
jgi:RNA-directed DNA polymerase